MVGYDGGRSTLSQIIGYDRNNKMDFALQATDQP
jgi:hypothetical protein